MRWSCKTAARWAAILSLFLAMGIAADCATAQQSLSRSLNEKIEACLASGEFGSARQLIDELPRIEQANAKTKLAFALRAAGMQASAVQTIDNIQDAPTRLNALRWLQGGAGQRGNAGAAGPSMGKFPGTGSSSGGSYEPGVGSGLGQGRGGLPEGPMGGAGGAAIADFDSLMELIRTTIAPDTWEDVGGPSTMAPYRGGIYVDPNGFVRDVQVEDSDRFSALRNLAIADQNATDNDNRDWTRPSTQRIVSLRRLRRAVMARGVAQQPVSTAMANLGGLSEVEFVVITDDDILLVGHVGGIDPAASPWPNDRSTGRVALGLDLLSASASAVITRDAYGCSIDPTAEGLVAAQKVSQSMLNGEIPTGTAAEALSKALGPQSISLFAVPGDSPLAWLLVDADRHMKQLALGEQEMPDGVLNYLQIVESSIKAHPNAAPPSGELLRLWFAAEPKTVRQSTDGRILELAGLPIKLLSAKEFAERNGQRVQAGPTSLGDNYAAQFNSNFGAIASRYPVYDRLRGAFELTATMEIVRRTVGEDKFRELIGELAYPDFVSQISTSVPKQCQSIAVHHPVRVGRKKHHVFVASGGVHIDPGSVLVSKVEPYPQLDDLASQFAPKPVENNRWWWDQ